MLVKCWAMLVTGRSAEADENLHGENTGRHSTSVTSFCPHRWNVPVIKPLPWAISCCFGFSLALGSCISRKHSSAAVSLLSPLPHASRKYG